MTPILPPISSIHANLVHIEYKLPSIIPSKRFHIIAKNLAVKNEKLPFSIMI